MMISAEGNALKESFAYCLGMSGSFYQEIMEKRFGIGTHQPFILNDLASEVGCTRERVRQIEKQFLEQMAYALKANPLTFGYWNAIKGALAVCNKTWTDGQHRVETLLGLNVYLPGLYRLADAIGIQLPAIGLDGLAAARGLTPESVRYRLETTLACRIPAKDVTAWLTPPPKTKHRDAPEDIIEAFLRSDEVKQEDLPEDLQALTQPELIRELMLRSGKTRRQMMEYLKVHQSTFDRWLWPADSPMPMPLSAQIALARLAQQVEVEPPPPPRKRHLGPPKVYALNGVPGLVRHSTCRDTQAVIALYRRDQAQGLPAESEGPWTTVCESHGVVLDWERFIEGLGAMSQSQSWCPDCKPLAPPIGAQEP